MAERIDPMAATVRLADKNHQPFSALWRFEQGQVNEKEPIAVRELDATALLALQDGQLPPQRGILRL
jgi:hypothetical protein